MLTSRVSLIACNIRRQSDLRALTLVDRSQDGHPACKNRASHPKGVLSDQVKELNQRRNRVTRVHQGNNGGCCVWCVLSGLRREY